MYADQSTMIYPAMMLSVPRQIRLLRCHRSWRWWEGYDDLTAVGDRIRERSRISETVRRSTSLTWTTSESRASTKTRRTDRPVPRKVTFRIVDHDSPVQSCRKLSGDQKLSNTARERHIAIEEAATKNEVVWRICSSHECAPNHDWGRNLDSVYDVWCPQYYYVVVVWKAASF
jgi:hypothetical protein